MGEYQNFYVGKIGADNFALMLIGALFAVHYYFDRQPLFFCCAIHFLTYGFLFDLYRMKFFRPYLIFNLNFTAYRSIILVVCLVPLYAQLMIDIFRDITKR